jgi:hypothetical protein
MNYKEDVFSDVYTLAHEAGHSMHTWFSQKTQRYQDYNYPIFLAEVASTFNEELLTHYLLEQTDDPKMRAYIINRQIDDIRGTLYRQTMFAEFEKIIHAVEERGDALTLEVFKTEYRALLQAYFGEGVVLDPQLDLECLRIPHFYSAFYVYKYSTGISAAVALSERVLAKEPGAVDAYLDFLRSGGSKFPLATLQAAGVDMTSSAPVESTLRLFERRLGRAGSAARRLGVSSRRAEDGRAFCSRRGVDFHRQVQAACGYAELGMFRESLGELDAIEPRMQNRPEVLQLRLHHLMHNKRWLQALRVSQALCRVAPDSGTGSCTRGSVCTNSARRPKRRSS